MAATRWPAGATSRAPLRGLPSGMRPSFYRRSSDAQLVSDCLSTSRDDRVILCPPTEVCGAGRANHSVVDRAGRRTRRAVAHHLDQVFSRPSCRPFGPDQLRRADSNPPRVEENLISVPVERGKARGGQIVMISRQPLLGRLLPGLRLPRQRARFAPPPPTDEAASAPNMVTQVDRFLVTLVNRPPTSSPRIRSTSLSRRRERKMIRPPPLLKVCTSLCWHAQSVAVGVAHR